MAEPRNPNDRLPDPQPHCATETPQAVEDLTDIDEGLRAAREAEKHSSAGS